MMEYLMNDPSLRFILALAGLCLLFYFIMAAFFETWERNRVVEAAKKWAERKTRRALRAESAELWDSVNALKRGQEQQGLDDKLPAYKRRTPKELE